MADRSFTIDELLKAIRLELFGKDNIGKIAEDKKEHYYIIVGIINEATKNL